MAFVRVLSAIPKVPPLRVIPFLSPGLAACRVPSALLRLGLVRPPSGLPDVTREDATRDEVAVPLLVVLLATPVLSGRCGVPLFFDLSPIDVPVRLEETRAGFVPTAGSLLPIEGVGLFAALPTVSREVMGLT